MVALFDPKGRGKWEESAVGPCGPVFSMGLDCFATNATIKKKPSNGLCHFAPPPPCSQLATYIPLRSQLLEHGWVQLFMDLCRQVGCVESILLAGVFFWRGGGASFFLFFCSFAPPYLPFHRL